MSHGMPQQPAKTSSQSSNVWTPTPYTLHLEDVLVCHVISDNEEHVNAAAVLVVLDHQLDEGALGHALVPHPHVCPPHHHTHRKVREHFLQVVVELLALQRAKLVVGAVLGAAPVPRDAQTQTQTPTPTHRDTETQTHIYRRSHVSHLLQCHVMLDVLSSSM